MAATSSRIPRRVRSAQPLCVDIELAERRSSVRCMSLVAPVMPSVFIVSPDGESSFCAFASDAPRSPTQSISGSALPSPSAPDFSELDKNLDFLERSADEVASTRRSRQARRGVQVKEKIDTWLQHVDSDNEIPAGHVQDAQEEQEPNVAELELRRVSSRAVPDSQSQSPAPRSQHSRSLRHKASLAFKRAFSSTSNGSSTSAQVDKPLPPRPSTPTASQSLPTKFDDYTLESTLPARPVTPTPSSPPERQRSTTKSRILSLFKLKKPAQQAAESIIRPSTPLPPSPPSAKSQGPPPPSPKKLRRPFSALALGALALRGGDRSTVAFPADTCARSSESGSTAGTSLSRETRASAATMSTVATSIHTDDHHQSPMMCSSANSSTTTLGSIIPSQHQDLQSPLSSPMRFTAKRLDSLHFDSSPLIDLDVSFSSET